LNIDHDETFALLKQVRKKSLVYPQKSPLYLQKSPAYPPKRPSTAFAAVADTAIHMHRSKEPSTSAKEPYV